MGKQKKTKPQLKKQTASKDEVGDPKITLLEKELVAIGQRFTKEVQALAEQSGVTLTVRIQMIPQLKERANGSK